MSAKNKIDIREKALELSARFAQIGEEPAISTARAEMFLDFLSNGKSLPKSETK